VTEASFKTSRADRRVDWATIPEATRDHSPADDRLADHREPPVGWEVEWDDLLASYAAKLPPNYAPVFLLMYGHCRGGTVANVTRASGLSRAWVRDILRRSIEIIRREIAG